MQTPESFPPAEQEPFFEPEEEIFVRPAATGFWALGGRLAWIAGLVLTISAFTDWYAGPNTAGPTLAVIAWHTGVLGKLVFVVGLAADRARRRRASSASSCRRRCPRAWS